jgi:hypothetical protein
VAALASVGSGLHAAILLARGRPEALDYVEPGLDGARRSFWAAAVCLPLFAALRIVDWLNAGGPLHAFGIDLLGYIVGWAGFALMSRPLADWMGCGERWPRFIAAWNWCNVAQYALLVAAAAPGWLDAPAWASEAAGLIALGWAVWLEWYAARLTLNVGALAAAAMTGADFLLGLVVASLTGSP